MCPFSKKYPEYADKYLITHLLKPKRFTHFKKVTLRTDAENYSGTFEFFKMSLDRKTTFDDFIFQKAQDKTLSLDEYLRSKVYKEIYDVVGNSNFSSSEISFRTELDCVAIKVVAKIY